MAFLGALFVRWEPPPPNQPQMPDMVVSSLVVFDFRDTVDSSLSRVGMVVFCELELEKSQVTSPCRMTTVLGRLRDSSMVGSNRVNRPEIGRRACSCTYGRRMVPPQITIKHVQRWWKKKRLPRLSS